MKFTIGVIGLFIVGLFGWYIGSRLSADAIGMAVGILFGILAGIPVALMVMATRQQADRHYSNQQQRGGAARNSRSDQMAYTPQAPVIVLAGNSMPHQLGQANGYGQYGAHAQTNQHFDGGQQPVNQLEDRQFRVVGEQESWIDGWS